MKLRAFAATFFAALILFTASAPGQETSPCPTRDLQTVLPSKSVATGGALQMAACCKICRKGKACGNSCISRSKKCTKPPGCACDGDAQLRGETGNAPL